MATKREDWENVLDDSETNSLGQGLQQERDGQTSFSLGTGTRSLIQLASTIGPLRALLASF